MTEEEDKGYDQLKHYESGGSGAYPESHNGHRNPVRVTLPEEPPDLPPEAARALLRIIRRAYAQRSGSDTQGSSFSPGGQQNDPETHLE